MNTDGSNVFHALSERMHIQIKGIEQVLGRELTDPEKDNLREFVDSLHPNIKDDIETLVGRVG